MRNLIVLVILAPSIALAQQSPPQTQNDPSPPQAQNDPYASPPPGVVLAPPLPPPTGMPPASAENDPMALRIEAARSARHQWTGARVMNGFGGVISLLSAGLTISNVIYVAAAHYPPSIDDLTRPKPSDPAQVLSWVSSTSGAFSFGLAAGSLGWRHHILQTLDADTGRGLFWGGTITGLVGVASIAVSYIVGFVNMANPHDQSIAVLSTSLGGSMLANVGTAMLASDAGKVQKAWKNLTSF
ncbi:MAG TPA: hypothetical protein VN947_17970 [Polyangia bacterium]|nr:hypothetical protein [Polyangia bacterium]